MYYKIRIDETGRNNLKQEEAELFNVEVKTFRTLPEVADYIIERYGKIPKRRITNTIYQDPDSKVVGFLHSFWNKDCSHSSKSWYQTDWVSVTKVIEIPVLVN